MVGANHDWLGVPLQAACPRIGGHVDAIEIDLEPGRTESQRQMVRLPRRDRIDDLKIGLVAGALHPDPDVIAVEENAEMAAGAEVLGVLGQQTLQAGQCLGREDELHRARRHLVNRIMGPDHCLGDIAAEGVRSFREHRGCQVHHVYRDRCRVGATGAVRDGIGEAVGADKTGIGRIGERTVTVVHNRAVGRIGHTLDRQRIAVGISIVGQRQDDHRLIGPSVDGIIFGLRRIVADCIHGNADSCRVPAAIVIRRRVREAIRAVKVGIGCVSVCSVTAVNNCAVVRLFDALNRERITVTVAVIGQQICRTERHRYVFVCDEGVVLRIRAVVR